MSILEFEIPLLPGTCVRFRSASESHRKALAELFSVSTGVSVANAILEVTFVDHIDVTDGVVASEAGVLAGGRFLAFDRNSRLAEIPDAVGSQPVRLVVEASVSMGFYIPNILIPAIQVSLRGRGTLIHGGCAADPSGRVYLFPAWGGVGKTSAILHLALRRGWKLIADDLCLLSIDGRAHPFIRTVNVLDYNLIDFPELRPHFSLVARTAALLRGVLHRLHHIAERLSGPDSVVAAVAGKLRQLAKALSNAKVPFSAIASARPSEFASESDVAYVVVLRRSNGRKSAVESIELTDSVVQGMVATLQDEFQRFSRSERARAALGGDSNGRWEVSAFSSLQQSLQRARIFRLTLAIDDSPADLIELVDSLQ